MRAATPGFFHIAGFVISMGAGGSALAFSAELVREYYNTQLEHYFLAIPGEADLIDHGGAGPGWQRTGDTFYADTPVYPFYSFPVCRFYGSISPGPNSHFFTMHAAECAWLQELAASLPANARKWNYEGRGFVAFAVDSQGNCQPFPDKMLPVYRVYNRGFERGVDSNHRYTTSLQTVAEMVQKGWVDEGIAWCAWKPEHAPR